MHKGDENAQAGMNLENDKFLLYYALIIGSKATILMHQMLKLLHLDAELASNRLFTHDQELSRFFSQ